MPTSTAVSASHIPSGSRPNRWRKSAIAPEHLGLLVARAGQGQDHVIVDLGQRVAVPPPPLLAEAVGLDDALQHLGGGLGHPVQERRAEVEADPGIVVQEIDDPPLAVEQPGPGVGGVAFVGDPLVPVVERGGRVLDLDDAEPGVLARGLVEVAVDADVSGMAHAEARFLRSVAGGDRRASRASAGMPASRPG